MHLLQLLEICPSAGKSKPPSRENDDAEREVKGQLEGPEQICLHPWDSGGICDSHHWSLFLVKTFKAVIKININDISEELR